MTTLTVNSNRQTEMIEITDAVRAAVRSTGIQSGLAVIYTPHTTAAITINENADPDVVHDMLSGLEHCVPDRSDFRHNEGNSAAHIKSSLVAASETVIIHDRQIVLGTWQGIFFCEFDGPRSRRVHVQVVGA